MGLVLYSCAECCVRKSVERTKRPTRNLLFEAENTAVAFGVA